MVAGLVERSHAFALDELSAGDAAGNQSAIANHFFSKFNGGGVDALCIGPITGAAELFASAKEGQRLQNVGASVEELAVKFTQRFGILDGNFRSKLSAATAGADFLATRTAVDIAAAFQFDEITAV